MIVTTRITPDCPHQFETCSLRRERNEAERIVSPKGGDTLTEPRGELMRRRPERVLSIARKGKALVRSSAAPSAPSAFYITRTIEGVEHRLVRTDSVGDFGWAPAVWNVATYFTSERDARRFCRRHVIEDGEVVGL